MTLNLTRMLNSLCHLLYRFVSLINQIQVDIPVASLNLTEDKSLVTSSIAMDDAQTQRTDESKSCLQQTLANLEINLCAAEEEKLKIKKVCFSFL